MPVLLDSLFDRPALRFFEEIEKTKILEKKFEKKVNNFFFSWGILIFFNFLNQYS